MADFTLRTAERPLPGGRVLRIGVYADERGDPLLAVVALGYASGGVADVVDPREEDRIVLPGSALGALAELVGELEEATT